MAKPGFFETCDTLRKGGWKYDPFGAHEGPDGKQFYFWFLPPAAPIPLPEDEDSCPGIAVDLTGAWSYHEPGPDDREDGQSPADLARMMNQGSRWRPDPRNAMCAYLRSQFGRLIEDAGQVCTEKWEIDVEALPGFMEEAFEFALLHTIGPSEGGQSTTTRAAQ